MLKKIDKLAGRTLAGRREMKAFFVYWATFGGLKKLVCLSVLCCFGSSYLARILLKVDLSPIWMKPVCESVEGQNDVETRTNKCLERKGNRGGRTLLYSTAIDTTYIVHGYMSSLSGNFSTPSNFLAHVLLYDLFVSINRCMFISECH